MYTNGINANNAIKEEKKPQMESQSFNSDCESFSDLMGDRHPSGNG